MKSLITYFSQHIPAALLLCTLALAMNIAYAQESAKEEDFFKIAKVSSPEGTILEVGGLCTLPNGDIAVTTRRGDIFIVENPSSAKPYFRKFASGLHEVLGVAYKNGSLYVVQRGELTRLYDSNMDGKADVFETIYAWPLSGNYHEYSFGPKIAPDGSFFVTLNLGFPDVWWHAQSFVPWRGWTLHIFEDGTMEPWATGMRSPCGISMIDGELWYTDNQGDWVGSGSLMPIKKGAFTGHPGGLRWTGLPNSPLHLTTEEVYKYVNPRLEFDANNQAVKPQNIVNEKFATEYQIKSVIPQLQLPAVWLPHGIYGISNSEIVKIPKGVFGPFEEQLLVGDQGQSKIMRVFMEKVNGEMQGCAWDFRSGFQSGIVRLTWGNEGSLYVGETNRGWGSAGDANQGLQRLFWNNQVPFEMRTVKAMPDGFEISFTKPVDKKYAEDLSSYTIESFIYKYQSVYGSPMVNTEKCPIKGVKVSADGLTARIIVGNLRKNYIHHITLEGIRDMENKYSLVHPSCYYTLNNIPEGSKLSMAEVSTKNTAKTISNTTAVNGVYTYAQIKPLLVKYTCVACHNPDKKQVGPGFIDIAKRQYSIDKILQLIKNPQPKNWPDYATPMAPMPNVPASDARKIAAWINSLAAKK
ncbi:c-type cytochrome [Limnovirga soli]|nr:c-type cytochrome [Limnovirga soli]